MLKMAEQLSSAFVEKRPLFRQENATPCAQQENNIISRLGEAECIDALEKIFSYLDGKDILNVILAIDRKKSTVIKSYWQELWQQKYGNSGVFNALLNGKKAMLNDRRPELIILNDAEVNNLAYLMAAADFSQLKRNGRYRPCTSSSDLEERDFFFDHFPDGTTVWRAHSVFVDDNFLAVVLYDKHVKISESVKSELFRTMPPFLVKLYDRRTFRPLISTCIDENSKPFKICFPHDGNISESSVIMYHYKVELGDPNKIVFLATSFGSMGEQVRTCRVNKDSQYYDEPVVCTAGMFVHLVEEYAQRKTQRRAEVYKVKESRNEQFSVEPSDVYHFFDWDKRMDREMQVVEGDLYYALFLFKQKLEYEEPSARLSHKYPWCYLRSKCDFSPVRQVYINVSMPLKHVRFGTVDYGKYRADWILIYLINDSFVIVLNKRDSSIEVRWLVNMMRMVHEFAMPVCDEPSAGPMWPPRSVQVVNGYLIAEGRNYNDVGVWKLPSIDLLEQSLRGPRPDVNIVMSTSSLNVKQTGNDDTFYIDDQGVLFHYSIDSSGKDIYLWISNV